MDKAIKSHEPRKKAIRIAVLNLQTSIGVTKGYWQYPIFFWKYFLPHSSYRLADVACFINNEKIGIVGLIEIDGGSIRTKNVNQLAMLHNKTSLKHKVFFPTHKLGSLINHGNAVLSNYPLLKYDKIRLPGKGEPRYLIRSQVKIGRKIIKFFLSHLSLNKKTRKEQIQIISETLGNIKGPAIFMGDLNSFFEKEDDQRHRGELTPILKKGFKYINEPDTYPSWKPRTCIDHILFKDIKVKKIHAYNKKLFSDHLPLIAEIEI